MALSNYSQKELIAEVGRLKKEYSILNSEYKKNLETVKSVVAKISHELKTPLNSIIGFGELIQYKTTDEKLVVYTKNILKSSEHMLSLVQNIIDVINMQYKPMKPDYSIFNTAETIEEVIKSFNNENIKPILIDIAICADYTRFKQLVYNLVSNAVKFSLNSQIDIITYIEDNMFCFEITDYGKGIKQSDYKRIFELFVQVDSDLNSTKNGSGIGLALCKTIVNAHKGIILVNSKFGKNTTFIFKIPIEFKEN